MSDSVHPPVEPVWLHAGPIPAHLGVSEMNKTHSFKVGRDAKTGEFIPVKDAIRKPNTTVVETIKIPVKKSK